jgi:hypothetical protein
MIYYSTYSRGLYIGKYLRGEEYQPMSLGEKNMKRKREKGENARQKGRKGEEKRKKRKIRK